MDDFGETMNPFFFCQRERGEDTGWQFLMRRGGSQLGSVCPFGSYPASLKNCAAADNGALQDGNRNGLRREFENNNNSKR